MPFQETINERYWCPGWWPSQWGRMCTRRVARWCYEFAWVETVNYGIVARYRGCEANVNHEIGWKVFFFFGVKSPWGVKVKLGTSFSPGGRFCYAKKLSVVGGCTSFPPPPMD